MPGETTEQKLERLENELLEERKKNNELLEKLLKRLEASEERDDEMGKALSDIKNTLLEMEEVDGEAWESLGEALNKAMRDLGRSFKIVSSSFDTNSLEHDTTVYAVDTVKAWVERVNNNVNALRGEVIELEKATREELRKQIQEGNKSVRFAVEGSGRGMY